MSRQCYKIALLLTNYFLPQCPSTGAMMNFATPTLASLTLGVSLTPTFLDYLARTQPEDITEDYYYGEETLALKKHMTELPDIVMGEEDSYVLPNYVLKDDVHV